MQQRDYLLREIEKIGILLRGILGKLTGKEEDLHISVQSREEKFNELLKHEAGFDLASYLDMKDAEAREYLEQFKGLNSENMEILAEILYRLGVGSESQKKRQLFGRALEILQGCKESDRSFSFEREALIAEINSGLTQVQ